MKILVAIVSLAALGAVAGAIAIGVRLKEPTVVADPYEAGLRYDEAHHQHDAAAVGPRAAPACDLGQGPCARPVAGATVTFELGPRPLRAMRELEVAVSVSPPAAAGREGGRLTLDMPGMYMGENRVVLAPAGEGRWRGQAVVVRCPSGRRTWTAELELPPPGAGRAPLRATFTFDVAD